jgi:hypothetical protein
MPFGATDSPLSTNETTRTCFATLPTPYRWYACSDRSFVSLTSACCYAGVFFPLPKPCEVLLPHADTPSLQVCDWDRYDDRMRDLVMLVKHQIDHGHFPSVHPHHTFLYPLPNTLRKAIATAHANAAQRNVALLNKPPYDHSHAVPLKEGERLRVGYVSSDFKVQRLTRDWNSCGWLLTCFPLCRTTPRHT